MNTGARRVLQLCHGYGAPFADVARQWAALFADSEWRVTTAYLTGEADADVVRASGSAEVLFLGFDSRQVRGLKLAAVSRLRALQREGDFALAIAHRFKPVYTCCLALNTPVVAVHHGFGDYRRLGRQLFARAFASRLALVGVSDAVRDDLRASLPGWPAERICTQYNYVDPAALRTALASRDAARRALELPHDAYVFGNVGRLHPDKDQATLLRAFALLAADDTVLLAIAGSGRLEGSLRALADALQIAARVRFLGQVAEMRRYFRAFDSFILTSDHEPFGMVLLEAIAADLPVIASDCGGAREVVAGDAWRFPLRDAAALATLLARVRALEEEQRTRLLAAQREHLQANFSPEAARRQFWQQPFLKHWHATSPWPGSKVE